MQVEANQYKVDFMTIHWCAALLILALARSTLHTSIALFCALSQNCLPANISALQYRAV